MAKGIGLGTIVKVDHDSDTNYTVVVQIRNPELPPRNREKADVTSYDDTLRAFVPGIEGESQPKFQVVYDPGLTSHGHLKTLFDAGTIVNWQFLTPSPLSDTYQFAAFIESMTFPPPGINEPYLSDITLCRTGTITIS